MKIGIDLGGSHIAIGLVDDNYKIIEKRTYYMNDKDTNSYEEYITNSIYNGINDILKCRSIKIDEIQKIGIATPGNPKDGVIKNVVNLGITEFDIVKRIKQAFKGKADDIEIKVANDGKCAGLAEKQIGNLSQYNDCIFLCIGTGIGGAAFMNNQFLKPIKNSGFEFGHMVIKKDGEQCKCGNKGCFEVYCSKLKLKQKLQQILGIQEYIGAKELTKRVFETKS
jgi:glucokinase